VHDIFDLLKFILPCSDWRLQQPQKVPWKLPEWLTVF